MSDVLKTAFLLGALSTLLLPLIGEALGGSPGLVLGFAFALVNALRQIESARAVLLDANRATAHMFIVKPFSGACIFPCSAHIRQPKRVFRRCSIRPVSRPRRFTD